METISHNILYERVSVYQPKSQIQVVQGGREIRAASENTLVDGEGLGSCEMTGLR